MPNKITSTSSGKDYYRRDFSSNQDVDKHGNKTTKDYAGNARLIAKTDGCEEPDFSYQKKYNMDVYNDKFGNQKVDISVLDDAFIENLINVSKNILDDNTLMKSKILPEGNLEMEEEKLTDEGINSLQKIINSYQEYQSQKTSDVIENSETMSENEETPKIICNNCNTEIPSFSNFCPICGVKILTKCPICGTIILNDANFCSNCGEKIK